MTKCDCRCEGAGKQRWGQADETIDGRMAGWLNGWMVVVLFCVWMSWLAGWLCDGLSVDNHLPALLGQVPWANRITAESQRTRYYSGVGVTKMTSRKEHTTSNWEGAVPGSPDPLG